MFNDIIEYCNTNSAFLSSVSTIALVIITGYYAYLTRKILIATNNQSKVLLNPVIGITLNKVIIGEVFGPNRRNMSVNFTLTNVGNAPAIDLKIDSEIHYRYTSHKIIPARFEPDVISFVQQGQEKTKCDQNFGDKAITHFFDDVRESYRLNIHRIKTDPSQESYKCSRLFIFIYFKNSLNHYFKSTFEVEIDLVSFNEKDPIPKDNEHKTVDILNIPRPSYSSNSIKYEQIEKEIFERNKLRDLSGW